MARSLNKVTLIGNLGADPEVRYTPNGSAVVNLSIATTDSWKDKQTGQPQERTEWHRTVIFGKLAEIAGQYLRKGSKVYLEGRLQTRKWQDQQGQDRYTTEVVIDGFTGQMLMLDSAPGTQQRSDTPPRAASQAFDEQPSRQEVNAQQDGQEKNTNFDQFDDDIPF